ARSHRAGRHPLRTPSPGWPLPRRRLAPDGGRRKPSSPRRRKRPRRHRMSTGAFFAGPGAAGGRGVHPGLRGVGEGRPRGAGIDWRVINRVLAYTRPHATKRNFVFALTFLRALQKPALAWLLAAIING